MSPQSAAVTRADLADTSANPVQQQATVHVALRFTNGVAFNPADIPKLLSHLGVPSIGAVPSRRSFDLDFMSVNAQLVTNPSGEVDASGWSAVAGGAVARVAAIGLAGSPAIRFTAAGVAFEGSQSAIVNVPSAGLIRASAWVKSAAFTNGLALVVRELDSAGVFIAQSTTPITLNNQFAFYSVQRQFSAAGVKAQAMIFGAGTPVAAETFIQDNVALGLAEPGLAVLTDTSLNPSATEDGMRVMLHISAPSFDPVLFYDALDTVYATVASDKDRQGQGCFEFVIS